MQYYLMAQGYETYTIHTLSSKAIIVADNILF